MTAFFLGGSLKYDISEGVQYKTVILNIVCGLNKLYVMDLDTRFLRNTDPNW